MGRHVASVLAAIALLLAGIVPAQAVRPPVGADLSLDAVSPWLEGYDEPAQVEQRLAQLPLTRIEGVWEFPQDGGTVVVERAGRHWHHFNLVALKTANRSIRPGTVLGVIRASAKPDTYEAVMLTAVDKQGRLAKPRKFTLKFDDRTASVTFQLNRKGITWNWWRMLPYMFRFHVTSYDTTPADLDGLRRLWPPAPVPAEPHYL